MKVTVFGAGYVGLVAAACLAEMGNSVVGVDVDAGKVARLMEGEVPIHEPGLADLIARNRRAARLSFTTDLDAAVDHGTLLFIAVGTPPAADGSADLGQVLAVAREIGRRMCDFKVVVDKSTVPVGTAERVRQAIAEGLRERAAVVPHAIVSNPEFLKEGAAIEDFMWPARVVIGCDDERAELLMRSLYAPFLRNRDRVLVMDIASAELTKYAANAMLATRISFMNELAAVAEGVGADIEQVRRGIGSDERIGTHFLYAGCGFGGSCFPKDLRALERTGRELGLDMPLLRAVRAINARQQGLLAERVIERFGEDLGGHRFAMWGLAFKPGTDDLREAPSLVIAGELMRRGASIAAYDPVARPDPATLWTSDAPFVQHDDAMSALDGASALLVVTEWREFRSPDFAEMRRRLRHPLILDGRNLYDPRLLASHGLDAVGIGRPPFGAAAPALDPGPHTAVRLAA